MVRVRADGTDYWVGSDGVIVNEAVIILDRDGVLNDMVVDPEHGTIDSPLHPSQVTVFPWVPEAVRALTDRGFRIFIATNQPAAKKGKTTQVNLQLTHDRVVQEAQQLGGRIEESFICWDRDEDRSFFRKPQPGMLLAALKRVESPDLARSWMVGDGVVDIQAGIAAGLKTAFIGAVKCPTCRVLSDRAASPTAFFGNLRQFADHLCGS